jgi:hypothetical protein
MELTIQVHLQSLVGIHSTLQGSTHLAHLHISVGLTGHLGHLGDQISFIPLSLVVFYVSLQEDGVK